MKRNESYIDTLTPYSIIPRTSQFKGNTMSMLHIGKDTPTQKLVLSNSYYMGSVIQTYNFVSNATSYDVYLDVILPNYARVKMIDMCKQLQCDVLTMYLDGGISVQLTEFNFNICSTKHVDGFKFSNNRDNINNLKDIQEYMKAIKRIVRYNDIADIMKHTYHSGKNDRGMKLDANRFFKLKQVKK